VASIKKSIITVIIILFLSIISTTTFAASPSYCPVAPKYAKYEWITKVSLNGGEKISGNSTYSDYTNFTLTNLTFGENYTLYVTANTTSSYKEFVKAWIDFNNDKTFTTDEEINLGNYSFKGNYTFSKNFTTPSIAIGGETRMRIYLKFNAVPSPCENATYGEVEDYKIKLPSTSVGTLEPYLITPTTDISVTKNQFFNFSTGVRCVGGDCGDLTASLDPEKEKKLEFVPRELIVKYKEKVDVKSSILISTGKVNIISREKLFQNIKHDKDRLDTFEKIKVLEDIDIINLAREYSELPNVEYAEPNYIFYISKTPNDASYNLQWTHSKIHSEEGWNITTGSTNITIAVIDTGIDWNHPDLTKNIWNNTDEVIDGIDNDGNGYVDDVRGYDFVNNDSDPMDDNGHGSHCSGIAAADSNNNLGVAGVCWNCKVMALKGCNNIGYCYSADLAQAIIYAVDNGAKIISMSWYADDIPAPTILKDAINYAYNSGVVLIAAAGNSNTDVPTYPQAYDNVFNVAATDNSDNKASFSNYGSWVDIAAPGVGIYSTYFDDTYSSLSGTSMAAPHVSGLAGLVLSHTPTLSNEQTYFILRNGVDQISDKTIGTGRINVYKALITKPIIPMYSGTPFYTVSQNPTNCYNMKAGETCNQTWTVNATGDINSLWNFFTIYNSSFETKRTDTVNVTIIENKNYITSCTVLDKSGATYYLKNDIINSTNETCINIIADGITLDCEGHNIDGIDSIFNSGIFFQNRNNITIKNCFVSDWGSGIHMLYSNNSMISNNIANSNFRGIALWHSSSNNTLFNNIANSNYYGINLTSSNNNTIFNNTANSNEYGIFLWNYSSNNTIFNNTANENGEGIEIFYSSNNNVINENIVCENIGLDFDISSSTGNSGTNNKCDKPDGWNDDGYVGCRYVCTSSPLLITINSPLNSSTLTESSSWFNLTTNKNSTCNGTLIGCNYLEFGLHACYDVQINPCMLTTDNLHHSWMINNLTNTYENVPDMLDWYNLSATCTDYQNISNSSYSIFFVNLSNSVNSWSVDLSITLDGDQQGIWKFGMSDMATDLFDSGIDDTQPPTHPDGFDAYFNESEPTPKDRLSIDIKSQADEKNWTLVVVAPANQTVNVTWDSSAIETSPTFKIGEINSSTCEYIGEVLNMKFYDHITIQGGLTALVTKAYRITASKTLYKSDFLELKAGWNMVSIPYILENNSVENIFDDKVESVWSYDNDIWYVWTPGLGGTLTTIEPKKGYWVAVDEDKIITFEGTESINHTIPLHNGWNLIGPIKSIPMPLSNPHIIGSIWGWTGNSYISVTDSLEPKKAYWIAADNDTTLEE